MRVLIAFGSKMGGTEELARTVGEVLRQSGHEIDVRDASELDGLQAWDAVVVGGALYAGRWKRSVRRFVERHQDELVALPVWFFSSGPLDDSAKAGNLAPTPQVRRLIDRVHARGHVTFGGRLPADAKGLIAHAMAKQGRAGDFRDMAAVQQWARTIAEELAALDPRQVVSRTPRRNLSRPLRQLLGVLCLFTALTAMAGGIQLMTSPFGPSGLNVSMLRHSPFFDYFAPGLLLFGAVGVLNLLSGLLALRRHRFGELVAFAGGSAITIWIASQMALLRTFSWLQAIYFAVGVSTMATALWLWVGRRAAVRSHAAPKPLSIFQAPQAS